MIPRLFRQAGRGFGEKGPFFDDRLDRALDDAPSRRMANSQFSIAVRALPIWMRPVGEGAKRTVGRADMEAFIEASRNACNVLSERFGRAAGAPLLHGPRRLGSAA